MVDMSAEAITAMLKLACELGRREPRPAKVPMDAASVTARLKSASELRDLCLRLGQWARSKGDDTDEDDVTRHP